MAQPYRWGDTEPLYFELMLNGVNQTGLTLGAGDVILILDESSSVDVTSQVTESSLSPGTYYVTPTTGQTQAKQFRLKIKDASAGGAFDDTAEYFYTGGHASAFLNGT